MKKKLFILGMLLISGLLAFGQVATPISSKNADFTAKFTITPSHSPMDGAFVLSKGAVTGWDDFSTIILFSSDQTIKVSDENKYKKINTVRYEAGIKYNFIMNVYMESMTYDVALVQNSDTVVLAKGYDFRMDVTELDHHVVFINELTAWGGVPGSSLNVQDFMFTETVEIKNGESNGFALNIPMEKMDDNFAMKFSIIPSHSPMDGLFVLTEGPSPSWDHLTSIILFASDRTIKVSDKNTYKKINAVTYNAGKQYDFIMNVDLGSMSYDVLLIQKSDTIVLGLDYAFRVEAESLDNQAVIINELEAWGGVPGSTLEVLNKEIIEPLEIKYGEKNNFAMNIPIKEKTEDFSVKFTAIPSHSPMDGLFTLSESPLENWNQISAGVRFNSSSIIDVVDGGKFDTQTSISYTDGEKYNFIMTMHMASMDYDVGYVNGEDTVILALGYKFRKKSGTLKFRSVVINELEAWGGVPGSSIDIQNVEITDPIALVIVADTVNSAPEMNSVNSKSVNINVGEKVLELSGINDGDDGTQSITITAKSSDQSVVADPLINYSGGETATLTYTPLAVGTTTITINLKDDGGTEDNGVDAAEETFDITVTTYKEASISFTNITPVIDGVIEDEWSKAEQFDITSRVAGEVDNDDDFSAYWKASWDMENLYILVDVVDDVLYDRNGSPSWDTDNIEIYMQMDGIRSGGPATGVGCQFSLKWNKGTLDVGGDGSVENTEWAQVNKGEGKSGYIAEFKLPWNTLKEGFVPVNDSSFVFDININDNEEANNGYAATYWNSYKSLWNYIGNAGIMKLTGYFAIAETTLEFTNNPPVIDGVSNEDAWNVSEEHEISVLASADGVIDNSTDCSGSWKATWDTDNLYVLVNVVDDQLWDNNGSPAWNTDNVEVYFQMDNNRIGKGPSKNNGSQISLKWNSDGIDISGSDAVSDGIEWKRTDNTNADGYIIEIKFPWGSLKPEYAPSNDLDFAFDVAIVDNEESNSTYASIYWSSNKGLWGNIDKAGNVTLSGYFAPIETTIQYADNAPVIDGVIDETLWENTEMNNCSNLMAGQVEDEFDASGYWKGAWDKDNFYLMVDVDDDILFDNDGNQDQETDNVEIYFQMDNNRDGSGPANQNGTKVSFRWNKNEADVTGAGTVTNEIEWMRRDKGIGEGGYVIEIKIPWKSLKDGYAPGAEMPLAFDVVIIDNEDGNTAFSALGWSSNECSLSDDMNKAGIINLAGTTSIQPIASISSQNFMVYPNPTTTGNFIISTSNKTTKALNIQIFDLAGKMVYSSDLHIKAGMGISSFNCNSMLGKGMYIIRLSDNSVEKCKRLLVE